MPHLTDTVLDAALNVIKNNGDTLHLCTSEPADYSGISGVAKANSAITYGSVADRSGGGRELTVNAVVSSSPGSVTGTGNCTHYAISDGTSTLYVTGAMDAAQQVTSGNTFTNGSFKIGIPDPS